MALAYTVSATARAMDRGARTRGLGPEAPARRWQVMASAPQTWEAGYGMAAITVDPLARPVYLAGFGVRRATAVRDPLEVHSVVLRHGPVAVIVVTADLIGLFREQAVAVEAACSAALGPDAPPVVVTCTHTHAGPDTLGLWGPDRQTPGVEPDVLHAVLRAAVRASVKAWHRLRPAELRVAQMRVEGLCRNVRDPDVLDPVLTLLAWDPVVRVLHLACHPQALGDGDTRLSADVAGVVTRNARRWGRTRRSS